MGINIYKNCFSQQNDKHTAKQCLSVVLKHFREIHRELFFLDIRVTISETSSKYTESWFFLPCLKRGNPEEYLDLYKQFFLIKPVKVNKH